METINKLAVNESAIMRAGFGPDIEKVRFKGVWRIEKFWHRKSGRRLIDAQEFPNLVTNVGGALMLDLLAAAGGTAFNNANAYIGIGDSTTAAAVGQTDLQAATNKLRKAMDATFPSRSGQVMTYKSTFATTDANYAWNEIGLFNASSTGTMFSRAVIASPFTKTSALSVVSTYTLTCP
jgi:hypothetical protein